MHHRKMPAFRHDGVDNEQAQEPSRATWSLDAIEKLAKGRCCPYRCGIGKLSAAGRPRRHDAGAIGDVNGARAGGYHRQLSTSAGSAAAYRTRRDVRHVEGRNGAWPSLAITSRMLLVCGASIASAVSTTADALAEPISIVELMQTPRSRGTVYQAAQQGRCPIRHCDIDA